MHNIMAYGFDRLNIEPPDKPIETENFTIRFESYDTQRRFHEYDGVVFCQGIFETFKSARGWDGGGHLSHTWDNNMLDRRTKEANLLMGKGGFICCIATSHFIDSYDGVDYASTDLSKVLTNRTNLYRKAFERRQPHVHALANELKRFLDLYGAASTHFDSYQKQGITTLARVGNHDVSICLDRNVYVIPSLPVQESAEKLDEYMQLLMDGVTALHNKSRVSLPDWAKEFQFEEEPLLAARVKQLQQEIAEIDSKTEALDRARATLVLSDEDLVQEVANVLELCLGVSVDRTDELKEDIKLISDGKIVAVGEVKGINRGVARAHINQADSHRERSGFDPNLPCLLIVNTGIKSAHSLSDKNQDIDGEQVKHAANMNVLVLRTLDILGLLKLVLAGKVERVHALKLLTTSNGWLRVDGENIQVLQQIN